MTLIEAAAWVALAIGLTVLFVSEYYERRNRWQDMERDIERALLLEGEVFIEIHRAVRKSASVRKLVEE